MKEAKVLDEGARIRARLDHPIIDADGHTLEFGPGFLDSLRQVGGAGMVERFLAQPSTLKRRPWYDLSWEQRRHTRATRPTWWVPPGDALDRATATVPGLLRERLDDIGLDFAIVYPTLGITLPGLADEELRRACCRALNTFHADVFREHAKRMTPVAVIPMHTPQEAIDELEHAITVLGMKAILIAGHVRRPIPALVEQCGPAASRAFWLDTFALDSSYDYDPFWAKCVEHRVAVASHENGMGWGSRQSISNYMYNHIGHFAASAEALCKSLFLGGVTRRFPTLKFAFLEGGVGWACNLLADLVGHWEKRNGESVQRYNPARLDRERYVELLTRYGGPLVQDKLQQHLEQIAARDAPETSILDEWAACQIKRAEDFRDLFVRNFYFGCEPDDPMNAWAFNSKTNPFGARLNAIFGSDIGHWDVPDMSDVVPEAYELVEHGLVTEEDFKDFVFTNPATLYAEMNPDFFVGTAVESHVRKLLGERKAR